MSDRIALHEPYLNGNEWRYVKECLDSGWVSSAGKFVDLFEEQVAKYTGASHAISCVNGTAALLLGLQVAGVKPEDEVIVPSLTFIASINAVHHAGGYPIFMDADEYSNIDVLKTIDFIENETDFRKGSSWSRASGKRIAAVMPVHVFGNAVDLEELVPFCEERNIAVVEDAAESMGTWYCEGKNRGKHAGTIGQIGCLSFNGNKIITCGGGGMILTNDSAIAAKVRYLSTQARDDSIHYRHDMVGYNFRLTNVQAAIGLAQLELLPEFLVGKQKIARQYTEALKALDEFSIAPVPEYANNNHWINVLRIHETNPDWNSATLLENFATNNIEVRPIWLPNYLQKPYMKSRTYRIEKAEELTRRSLCLPSSYQLTGAEISRIVNCLHE